MINGGVSPLFTTNEPLGENFHHPPLITTYYYLLLTARWQPLDVGWNPANHTQAKSTLHRVPGQTDGDGWFECSRVEFCQLTHPQSDLHIVYIRVYVSIYIIIHQYIYYQLVP